ncbi:MAG: aldo/keto reductase [Chloroflexi bacterium]|nr:aldo/keto reductase [Chloroflexota bacterium]
MQYRRLGKTGWQVSAISLGCWGIGGQWGPVAEEDALRAIQHALDSGVNLLDTADGYGDGESEERVGRAIRGRRDSVHVATKVGNFARRLGGSLSYTTPHHIYLCADASLGRMKIDYIDLYQCHIGNLDDPDIFLEAFEHLKQVGKIRAYGISTNSLPVLERFNKHGTCSAAQINYSILSRSAAKDILPYCRDHDIGTLIRGPLAQGLLAGKFTPQTVFTDSVRMPWNEGAAHERFLENLQCVEQLRFLIKPDRTLAQAALQFVLAHPAVTCAIPGAKCALKSWFGHCPAVSCNFLRPIVSCRNTWRRTDGVNSRGSAL